MSLTRRALLQGGASSALATAQPDRPNILLLFPDQWRFDWLQSTSSLDVKTPNLSALAARGTSFSKAIVPSPLCAPSRACLASGKEYRSCRVASNGQNYPLDQTTHYTMMRNTGYHTCACGKLDLHKATFDWGLDGQHCLKEWGFSSGIDNAGKDATVNSGAKEPKDPYMAYLYKQGLAAAHIADYEARKKPGYSATFPTPLPPEAYCDNFIGRNGLKLLQDAPTDKPWYLSVNFAGPHPPEDITRQMEATVRSRQFPQPNGSLEFTPEIHVAIRQNYTAMIENLDRWVGTLVDEVKRRGELDRTIVVFSSDHGEMLGDHNRWGKLVPWQPSVSVPLIFAGPKISRGKRIDSPVTTLDLAATFLDYSGLSPAKDMDSRSLRPLLEGKPHSHRDIVVSALGPWRMAWDGQYKLMEGFDPNAPIRAKFESTAIGQAEPLLFDLIADPRENRNIAAKAPDHLKRLRGAFA